MASYGSNTTLHGNNFDLTSPTLTLNGNASLLGTTLRNISGYLYQYVLEPSVTSPVTVTIGNIPSGSVVNYTFGPKYPCARVDNINCFTYSGPFTLTVDNHGTNGTYIYATTYNQSTYNGDILPNDQSPIIIAKFHISINPNFY